MIQVTRNGYGDIEVYDPSASIINSLRVFKDCQHAAKWIELRHPGRQVFWNVFWET